MQISQFRIAGDHHSLVADRALSRLGNCLSFEKMVPNQNGLKWSKIVNFYLPIQKNKLINK